MEGGRGVVWGAGRDMSDGENEDPEYKECGN